MENIFDLEDKFQLVKNSFLTTGSILRDCIKFLTSPKANQTQPVFIGDSRGILYVTEYKKQEPDIVKKTQAFPKEITCIDVHSSAVVNKERLFFSFGNSIFGTNRLCKDFSKIEFDIADTISMFRIMDNNAWTVSNNYISQYEYGDSTVEKGTYDNEVLITAMHLTEMYGKTKICSIIGSEDNRIKFVSGNDLIYSVPVSSAPTFISTYKKSDHDLSENKVIFGTSSGSLGLVNVDKDSTKLIWEINTNKNLGEIVGIKTFDINCDGTNEIIVIRSNGDVNIFSMGNTLLDVSMISKYQSGEVLTGIDIGKYRAVNENEIILSSYSGLVFSLTPQLNFDSNKVTTVDKKSLAKSIKEITEEVNSLKQLLEKKTAEFAKQQNNVLNPFSKNPFKLNYKLTLLPKEAVYHLKIESEFPMEMILMQSEGICLDILEIITKDVNLNIIKDDSKEKENINFLGYFNQKVQKNVNENSKFLCTFKLRESVHQLEIILRTYEGAADIVNCIVIPTNKPKTAHLLEIPIKALSLHKKVEEEKDASAEFTEENSLNTLTIKGKFYSNEMNQIISAIIPDIPEKTSKDNLKYYIKSTFLHTYIEICIDLGVCRIRSLNLSPLIIIKEQVTKEADLRKKEMEFNIQIKTISIFKMLEIIDPFIEENFSLETKYRTIQAFKELNIDNGIILPDEYLSILHSSEEITKKHEQRTINLHYLRIIVENLLKDISKVRSISEIHQKVNDISLVFTDYSSEKLIDVFKDLKNI